MRIHIVTETEGRRWVLRPLAEALAWELPDAMVGTAPDPDAYVNLFFNYGLYEPVETLAMAWFTHRECDWRGELFDEVARVVDWCFTPCKITAALLPPEKTTVLPTGPTDMAFYKRPLVLGVVGRDYPRSGRKRMYLVKDLRAIEGVVVRVTGGGISAMDMPAFFDEIDYLVVLSDNEGGPQPVLEALARCKPIIAPDVGYCWEYPVLRYSTKEALLSIVKGLVLPQDLWEQAARMVLEVLGKCNE